MNFHLYGTDGQAHGEFPTAAEARKAVTPVPCCVIPDSSLAHILLGAVRTPAEIIAGAEARQERAA